MVFNCCQVLFNLMLSKTKNDTNFLESDSQCVLKIFGSGGIRTHASEETGSLNQRLDRSATLPEYS